MELAQLRTAFDSKARAWDDYTRTPIGRLRQELTLRYLSRHLPEPARAATVLDAGGGTGDLAIALARRGFRVHLLDFARSMLDVARSRARKSDPIEYHHLPVEDVDRRFTPGAFDLIVCHTLLEYVPDPGLIIHRLAALLKPGGLLSLEHVNRHADALQLALARSQFGEARLALDGETTPADVFDAPRHIFDREQVLALLRPAMLEPIAEYGVSIFADCLNDSRWQTDETVYADLVALEEAAASREPHRSIARYGLVIARTRARSTPTGAPRPASGRREFWI